MNEQVLCDSC